jgi:hypothetical protein
MWTVQTRLRGAGLKLSSRLMSALVEAMVVGRRFGLVVGGSVGQVDVD